MELEKYYISQKGCNYILNPARGKMSRINPDEACTITTHMGEWQGNFISDDIESVQVNSTEYGTTEPKIIKMKNGDLIEYDGKEYRMIAGNILPESGKKHESDIVYDSEGNIGTIYATADKEPYKVLECKQAGSIECGSFEMSNRVYDAEGAAPTMQTFAGGNREPKIIEISHMVTETGKTHQTDVVYKKEGVAPTQRAVSYKQPTMVVEEATIAASRGRGNKGNTEQHLEIGGDVSNTITTVQKDNMVIQPKVLGNYTPSGHHNADALDDSGCSPTVMENHGTVNAVYEPRAYDEQNQIIHEDGTVGTLTTDGSSPKHNNRVIEPSFRIRKLTETECFRLMGVQDKDSRKIKQSKSSKYHLAGDSIVVQVLMAIFGEMTDVDWKTKLYESREGVLGKNELPEQETIAEQNQ